MSASHQAIALGRFTLSGVLGQGGMGAVWRGEHSAQRVPVAVKVIRHELVREPRYLQGFAREVQAVAALEHPGVCHVFDYGHVTPEAAEGSQGALAEGSPWLAMELAHSTLEDAPPMTSWYGLRHALLQILDALAHAHAREVIHRDIKPANVLRFELPGRAPRYALADFGLAHGMALSVSTSTAMVHASAAGTPHYMPPEQLQGHWRDYGPWTDLYAVACMAWELATGAPPFHADNFIMLASKHLGEVPGAFVPRFAVPAGFELWLRRLLEKATWSRGELAADAIWGLLCLPERADQGAWLAASDAPVAPPSGAGLAPTVAPTLMQTVALDATALSPLISSDAHWRTARLKDRLKLPPDEGGALRVDVAPMPETWRVAERAPDSLALANASLGLFGLREIPLIGREAERDVLWRALREVHHTRTPQVVIVRGPIGAGKSRLVSWFSQRASEVGAALTLRVDHDPQGADATSGLTRALQKALRCMTLSRDAAHQRVQNFLSVRQRSDQADDQAGGDVSAQADAILELIDPLPETAPAPIRFASVKERHHALLPYLRAVTSQRPLILWLEDAQWAHDSIGFVRTLQAHADAVSTPVLIILSVREEELHADPALARQLSALTECVQTLSIEPLDDRELSQLIDATLTLAPALRAQLLGRAQGRPLFATQLLADWVARDLICPSDAGFTLRQSAALSLPDSIHALWRARLAHVGSALGGWDERALQLAAALGHEVEERELRAAITIAGFVPLPAGALEAMAASGLARLRPGGWSFAHGLLRESLAREAREQGRWSALHACCLSALTALAGPEDDDPAALARRARHALEAARFDQARALAMAASQRYFDRSDYGFGLAALSTYRDACDRQGLPEEDLTRVAAWGYEAELLRFTGQVSQAQSLVARALATLPASPTLARAQALRISAALLLGVRELEGCKRNYTEALTVYESHNHARGMIQCLHGLGWLAMHQRHYTISQAHLARGVVIAQASGERREGAWCLQTLADHATREGDLERAAALSQQALQDFQQTGTRAGQGLCLFNLAELHLIQGELVRAQRAAEHSAALMEEIGSPIATMSHLYRALIALALGLDDDARHILNMLIPRLPAQASAVPLVATGARLARVLHAALGADATSLAALLTSLDEGSEELRLADRRFIRALHEAARAARALDHDLAKQLYQRAIEQAETLAMDTLRDALRAEAATLNP